MMSVGSGSNSDLKKWIPEVDGLRGIAIGTIVIPGRVWAEPLFEKVCPGKLATHGVFLFRKQQTLD